jgi:hypothetical protein
MSDNLIVQQDDPKFPLDPGLLIHAMWKELFDLEIMDFMIWPFEYRCPAMMFPTSIKDCDHEFETPELTDLYDSAASGLTIGLPAWVERFRYEDGNSVREGLEYEISEYTTLEEAFNWSGVLWAVYEGIERNEISLTLGSDPIDLLELDEFQRALADESHGGVTMHLFAKPIAQPGPAFEAFTYSGMEAQEALRVIASFLALEVPGSTPDNNAYCHALMLFAVHPHSTPASLELITQSTSASREFLKFNPSATPELLAKIQ